MTRAKLFVLTLVAVSLGSCRETTHPNETASDAMLTVRADVANLTIETMSVTVTGPGITTPLIFNFQTENGRAQGTITVRPGSARKFSARAFDESGVETHFGETSMDVRIAGNPTLRVVLVPHAGGVPVVVVLGGVLVAVTPSSVGVKRGETVQLSATVTNGDGGVINLPVTWATSNPAIATVSATGLVTALLAGEVQIVATAGGEAGAAAITGDALEWASVVAGSSHTCGLDTDGHGYCWGSNRWGQLGDGTKEDRSRPVPVAGNHRFLMLTSGAFHTCGLTSDGRTFCWGDNSAAQIGDGIPGPDQRTQPAAVAGGHTFETLSAHHAHTCGLKTGAAFCWGYNGDNQIYASPDAYILEPLEVGPQSLIAIRPGGSHTCALTSTATYCWGSNNSGQTGNDGLSDVVLLPTQVSGGHSFEALTSGANHTCGLNSAGKAFCWGSNASGQIGDGSISNRAQPTAVAVDRKLQKLAAGQDHTCAIASGNAMCWGFNFDGQLGNGDKFMQTLPTDVAGGFVFASIVPGGQHTCGVSADAGVYCWGSNSGGQLGDGTRFSRLTPVRVREP